MERSLFLIVIIVFSNIHFGNGASTPGFEAAAAELESAMDFTVNPCDDFFKFACGNWKSNESAPYNDGISYALMAKVFRQMSDAFSSISTDDSRQPPPFRMSAIAWNACLKGQHDDIHQDVKLLLELVKKFGGWPALGGQWRPNEPSDAAGLIGALTGTFAIETLITPQVSNDYWKPGRVLILFDMRQVGSDRINGSLVPYVPDKQVVAEYVTKVVHRLVGNEPDPDQLKKDAEKIAEIEVKSIVKTWELLNWVQPDPYSIPPGIYNPFTVSQAIRKWPNINWPMLLLKLAENNADLQNIFGYPFVITSPAYLDFVNDLFLSESPRDLQNFLIWKLMELELTMLPSMRDLYERYDRSGKQQNTEFHCAGLLMDNLPVVSSRLYKDVSPLTQFDIDELDTMIGVMLNAWHGMIQQVKWIDEPSRGNAFKKINHVARKVAFPSWITDDAALTEYYEQLNLTEKDNTFVIMNKVVRFQAWRVMKTIGTPADRYDWFSSSAVVNAWYMPSLNSITFPAAIMQTPMFNSTFPKSYNYGNTGGIMGHELGHAFDSSGVYWGPLGGYMPDTWMDAQSRSGFNDMAQCVVDEYNKFCFPQIEGNPCINGTQTITENLADNGGTIAAYRAYKAISALMGGEPRLPGRLSQFSHDQLFFISYAHSWASIIDVDHVIYQLQHDVHSPDIYRVIGVVQNMPEFATAFNCPTGSPMAPQKHCSVWV